MSLIDSCKINNLEEVKHWLATGANVNAVDEFGLSSLHFASMYGYLACVQALIAAGAEKDRPDKYGETPLTCAIRYSKPTVAEYFLHSGAKMNNAHPRVVLPSWMTDILAKRQLIMSSALVLKGVLKRRRGLSKDVTHLISIYFWNARLK
jgi:hypothetical protein